MAGMAKAVPILLWSVNALVRERIDMDLTGELCEKAERRARSDVSHVYPAA
jgi:hypothetical protein